MASGRATSSSRSLWRFSSSPSSISRCASKAPACCRGLHDQDRIFINKFVYHFEDISRGDVVVFYYPRDPSKSYIKRVIALPGDRLEVDDGRVYVNGVRIPEPYVPQRFRTCARYRAWSCRRTAIT